MQTPAHCGLLGKVLSAHSALNVYHESFGEGGSAVMILRPRRCHFATAARLR
jgi:hypothetical protein